MNPRPHGYEPALTGRNSSSTEELLSVGDRLGYRLTTETLQQLPRGVQTTTSSLVNSCLEITLSLIDSFDRWLAEEQGTGEKTRRDYRRYLSRIARPKRAGLAEEYQGLDARRRYYKLTRLGREVYERTRSHLLGVLAGKARSNTLSWEAFEAIARSLRLDPQ